MDTQRQSRVTAGLTLMVVGLVLFFIQSMEGFGDTAVFAALGAIFLVGYLWRKVYGLLVPAGILLGLAVGSYVEEVASGAVGAPDWTLFGLGCGFLLIYALDLLYRKRSRKWPIVPGAILVLLAFPVTERLVDLLVDHWPLLLVVIGAVIVAGALWGSSGSSGSSGSLKHGGSSAPPTPPRSSGS